MSVRGPEKWYGRSLILYSRSEFMVRSTDDWHSKHAGNHRWTVESYWIKREVKEWLTHNLPGRHHVRSTDPRESLIYFFDDEGATLFKLFWL